MTSTSNPSNNPTYLDWEQVKATINLLTLAVSQIECTMSDGERSVSELSSSFTFIANQLQNLISESNNDTTSNNNADLASEIHSQVVNSIISFQFYDRLSQRLDHVKRDLGWLSELVSDPNQVNDSEAWKKLQNDIKSNYSMEEERLMFEHIMNGATVEEALEIYRHHFEKNKDQPDPHGDVVDLF
jgi:hypothetical protein